MSATARAVVVFKSGRVATPREMVKTDIRVVRQSALHHPAESRMMEGRLLHHNSFIKTQFA